MAVTLSINKSDSVAHTEAVGRTLVRNINKSDAVSVAENRLISISPPPLSINKNEMGTVTEQIDIGIFGMTLTYSLKCGICGYTEAVPSNGMPQFVWTCQHCVDIGIPNPENVTSVATESDNRTIIANSVRSPAITNLQWTRLL